MDGKTGGNTTAGKTTAGVMNDSVNDSVSCSAPVPTASEVNGRRKRSRTRSAGIGTDPNSAVGLIVQSKRARTRQAAKDQEAKNSTVAKPTVDSLSLIASTAAVHSDLHSKIEEMTSVIRQQQQKIVDLD